MREFHPGRCGALACTAVALILISSALPVRAASDRDEVARLQIGQLASEGRCDDALPLIDRERAKAPGDASLALLQGQCRIHLFDYLGALDSLNDAKAISPDLQNLDLYLAIAHLHLEDIPAAQTSIAAAEGRVSDESMAQYELYSGLLALYRDEPREAALAFERARLQNAAEVEPVASYYAGMAWQSVNERELARESFERVIAVDGDGVWGKQAEAALGATTLAQRSWVTARLGMEYDTNVLVQGVIPPGVSGVADGDASDGRAVWFLDGGLELFRTEKFSGGVQANYAGNVHFHLRDFDTHYPTGGGWLDYDHDEQTLFRLRYNVGYAWVGYEDFVTSQLIGGTLYRNWGDPGRTELALVWDWANYHYPLEQPPTASGGTCGGLSTCAPEGFNVVAAQNRDGNGLRASLLHRYDIEAARGDFIRALEIRGGYAYRRYWSKGTDWQFQGHELRLGLLFLLPWELEFDLVGEYVRRPFDHVTSWPNLPVPDDGTPWTLGPEARLDNVYIVATEIEKPINDLLSVSTRYAYLRNQSNSEWFDYDRHVVGAYATLRF
jgi:tetratricopeptide (TPR) repeat protein